MRPTHTRNDPERIGFPGAPFEPPEAVFPQRSDLRIIPSQFSFPDLPGSISLLREPEQEPSDSTLGEAGLS